MKTRGEFCSARSFIFVRFEEAIGKLRIADVADDLLHVIRRYTGDGRHVAKKPVVLLYALVDSVANAEIRVMAGVVGLVD